MTTVVASYAVTLRYTEPNSVTGLRDVAQEVTIAVENADTADHAAWLAKVQLRLALGEVSTWSIGESRL